MKWLWQRPMPWPMPWQRLRPIPMKWQKLRPRPMKWLWQRPSHRKWLKIFCGRCGTQAIPIRHKQAKKLPTLQVFCAVSHWFCSRIKKSEKKVKKITTLILGGYNEHIERKRKKSTVWKRYKWIACHRHALLATLSFNRNSRLLHGLTHPKFLWVWWRIRFSLKPRPRL